MADLEILRSYMVRLGFQIDHPQLNQFNNTLRDLSAQVERTTSGISRSFVMVGATVGGALASIGAAAVGLMDNVAQSDLAVQLFATRMYMSTDAARKLKIATDALGHSLEEIAWNPELRQRYGELVSIQDVMMGGLGPDFEEQMRKIRDIRFEFTKLRVEAQYLGMALVKSLSKALFGDEESLLKKLKEFNAWLEANFQQIADRIASYLTPVLRDLERIGEDLWGIFEKLTSTFFRFLGALYDDQALKTGKVNLENFGLALDHIAESITKIFDAASDLAALLERHPKIAGLLLGAAAGGRYGGWWGAGFGAAAGLGAGAFYESEIKTQTGIADRMRQLAKEASLRTGMRADLIFGQWMHETGGFSSPAFMNWNNPAGIKDPATGLYRHYGSLAEGVADWERVIMLPRYAGARAATTAQGVAEELKTGGYYEDTVAHYARGLGRGAAAYAQGNTVTIGEVHIHTPSTDPVDHARIFKREVEDRMTKQTQRNLTEFSGPYAPTSVTH